MKERIYTTFHDDIPPRIVTMLDGLDATVTRCDLTAHTEPQRQTLGSYQADFLARFTQHSAAIEGSKLTTQDTQLVIDGEFLPRDSKELADMFSARGIYEGYLWAVAEHDHGRSFDISFIQDIHERTALDCQPATRGVFRQSAALITGSPVTPLAAHLIRDRLGDLIWAYNHSVLHPVWKIAAFHVLFEHIHPFIDGNGRTGRTIMATSLRAHGYPPIAIGTAERREYLNALTQWQLDNNPQPCITLITRLITYEAQRISALLDRTPHRDD